MQSFILPLSESGDTLTAALTALKQNMTSRAILSTFDGLTGSTAWHVISILGFHFVGSQMLTNNRCDYLEVTENQGKIQGFYFEFNKMLKEESLNLKSENSHLHIGY
jgi:hypothetical protein